LDALDDHFLITLPEFPLYGIPKFSKPHIQDLVERGLFPPPVWPSPHRRAWRAGDLKRYRAGLKPRAKEPAA
jgi:hypothetical protein